MNETLSLIPVRTLWAYLIVIGIVGSITMGTFAPSMEGVIQIIFAIGLGLVLYFGPEAEKNIQAQSWSNFGWYSLLLSVELLILNYLPLTMSIVFTWMYMLGVSTLCVLALFAIVSEGSSSG
jgi:hypothetical protein